ncbi:MAG: hypothetical protein LPL29_02650 [Alphaproteobacteria bacterium]|nr:hypothetical protein [Alphaproteobacteria bacterium]
MGSLARGNADLGQVGAHGVREHGALPDQQIAGREGTDVASERAAGMPE